MFSTPCFLPILSFNFLFDHIFLLPGGKLMLEMNRILRPSGYFILSTKNDRREEEEGVSFHMLLDFSC